MAVVDCDAKVSRHSGATSTALVVANPEDIYPLLVAILITRPFEEIQDIVFDICRNPSKHPQLLIDLVIDALQRRIAASTMYRDIARRSDDRLNELAVELSDGSLDHGQKHALAEELARLNGENYAAWAVYYQGALRSNQGLLQTLFIFLSDQNRPEDDIAIGLTPRDPMESVREMHKWLEKYWQGRELNLRHKHEPNLTMEELLVEIDYKENRLERLRQRFKH